MIRFIIDLYIFCIIVDSVLSFFPQVRGVAAVQYLRKICDVTQRPIRKYLPNDLPFDLSPVIVIFLLLLIKALW